MSKTGKSWSDFESQSEYCKWMASLRKPENMGGAKNWSDEMRQKLRDRFKDTVWVHKGTEEKRVDKATLQYCIDDGWEVGRGTPLKSKLGTYKRDPNKRYGRRPKNETEGHRQDGERSEADKGRDLRQPEEGTDSSEREDEKELG